MYDWCGEEESFEWKVTANLSIWTATIQKMNTKKGNDDISPKKYLIFLQK